MPNKGPNHYYVQPLRRRYYPLYAAAAADIAAAQASRALCYYMVPSIRHLFITSLLSERAAKCRAKLLIIVTPIITEPLLFIIIFFIYLFSNIYMVVVEPSMVMPYGCLSEPGYCCCANLSTVHWSIVFCPYAIIIAAAAAACYYFVCLSSRDIVKRRRRLHSLGRWY